MNERFHRTHSSMGRLILIVLVLFLATEGGARAINRRKRVSDQRLAELETLLALAKTRGKVVKVPVGFGRIDPQMLGRRKRTLDGERDTNEEVQCFCCMWSKQHPDASRHAIPGCDQYHHLAHRAQSVKTDSSNLLQFPFKKEDLLNPTVVETVQMS